MSWKLPWNSQQTPSEPPPHAIDAAPIAPDPLEARVSLLVSDVAGIRLEWAETLDKINRWASRQSARERRRADRSLDELGQDGAEIAQEADTDTNGQGAEVGSPTDRSARKAALRAQFNRRGSP